MHLRLDSPAFRPVPEYAAPSTSLSVSWTVPVVRRLPGFSGVDENAENVPKAAMAPAAPTPSSVLRRVFVRVISGSAPWNLGDGRRVVLPAAEPSPRGGDLWLCVLASRRVCPSCPSGHRRVDARI